MEFVFSVPTWFPNLVSSASGNPLFCVGNFVADFHVLNHLVLLHDKSIFGVVYLHPCRLWPTVSLFMLQPRNPHIDAKPVSEGQLTLSGRPFNQLDSADFAWHTRNSLSNVISIGKSFLCVNQKMITRCATTLDITSWSFK